MASSTIGLAGHGLLLAPACPCRVAQMEDLLVIGRGFQGPLLTEILVKRGTAPATQMPAPTGQASAIGPNARSFSCGPGGPELTIDLADGESVEDLLPALNVGLDESEWTVLAPGFSFELPAGMVVFSPDPETPGDLPELHLALHVPAMIAFRRIGRPAEAVVPTGPGGISLAISELETHYATVRAFAYDYTHEGVRWTQRLYVLPYDDARTIMMTAQAPVERWAALAEAADRVARTFAPLV